MLLAVTGCAGPDLDLNPFFVGRRSEGEESITESAIAFGPFWDDQRLHLADDAPRTSPTTVDPIRVRETAFHPFFRKYRSIDRYDGTSTDVWQWLYPLFQSRSNERLHEWRALWAWWWRRVYSVDGTLDEWDLFAPPLFAGGGEPGDDYLALFPLAGKVRAFAGFEEFMFVLFPLYYRMFKNITGPQTFHNITPLAGWVDGGPRDGSFRILPFYGRWVYKGRSIKQSWLWPIFHYHRDRLDQPAPSTRVTVWPLFSLDRSARHRFLSFLWLGFRWDDEWVPERVSVDGSMRAPEHYWRRDLFWPIWNSERQRTFERQRVFPFYMHYASEGLDRTIYAWPLIWKRTETLADRTKRSLDVIPVFHRETKSWADGRPPARSTRVWPLATWSNDGAGHRRTQLLDPLPSDALPVLREWKANIDPLFGLYTDEAWPDGRRRVQALWRLVDYQRDRHGDRWSVPLVYRGEREAGRTTHDILFGLIRFGWGRGGGQLRLLGLPVLSPEDDRP